MLPALSHLRGLVLDDQQLVRALASGRRKGQRTKWRRVELRYVDLKAGRHLQVTAYDDTQAHTSNHAVGDDAKSALDHVLDEPFGNWHVDTLKETTQLRVTKRLEAMVHTRPRDDDASTDLEHRRHDRVKPRIISEDDPLLAALGISDPQGRVKASRQNKYRQVEEFLRALAPTVDEALDSGLLRTPTDDEPLRVVDLGCGNAYLTFAAHRYLSSVRGLPVDVVGVDTKAQSFVHNTAVAASLGITGSMTFLQGDISSASVTQSPDIVLALHACDTATDDALARAVDWEAPLVLAAPCCHHDVAAQLRKAPTPAPYAMLTRHGILRERFADTLTDAMRASVLRLVGYRVDVMEFVESQHTPRNTLIRAVRTGAPATEDGRRELEDLVHTWGVRPKLAELLGARLC